MSLLYKDQKDTTTSLETNQRTEEEPIILEFYSDSGKFGTHESLAGFKLTPERLLDILQDRQDYTDEELEIK